MSNLKRKETPETSDSLKEGMATYLKGVRSEWDKITWPERKQVVIQVIVVFGVVAFFTSLVYLYDVIFNLLFKLIPNR